VSAGVGPAGITERGVPDHDGWFVRGGSSPPVSLSSASPQGGGRSYRIDPPCAVRVAGRRTGYIRANLGTRHRRAKTRRFLTGQLDAGNKRITLDLLERLRRFDHPTLLVWAENDPHFASKWGQRLRRDIPGAVGLELLPDTGHLLMEERPETLASLIDRFLAGSSPWPS
jgi:pimeloyl-ACP methyl ester carboxylesterase